jgi:hypothetical protein
MYDFSYILKEYFNKFLMVKFSIVLIIRFVEAWIECFIKFLIKIIRRKNEY